MKKIYNIFLFIFIFSVCATATAQVVVKGRVVDSATGEAISYAPVVLEPTSQYSITDQDGNFSIPRVVKGVYTVTVSHLGYYDYEELVNIDGNISLTIALNIHSFRVDDVNVMSKRSVSGEKLKIDQTAIEYVQPTSLHDIFLLLPGSIYDQSALASFKPISTRQVGSDSNSSLGVSVMADGIPISSDGMRSQMVGVTSGASGSYDSEIAQRSSINQGTDLRYISTDHIESVEFTKGISSAKFGDLSSGVIQVNSKKGVSALNVRLKSDLKNKLIYAGQGFELGKKGGTLNVGIDYLDAIDDIREATDKFTRMTSQLYYNRVWEKESSMFELDSRLNYTMSFNEMKKDELIYEYNEEYLAEYSKVGFMTKGVLTKDGGFFSELDFTASIDVVNDKISRHKMVLSTSGPLSMPTATQEGENQGAYLPGQYYSDYYIENIPVNGYFQANMLSRPRFSDNSFMNIEYGLDFRFSKNVGNGAVIADPLRPPYPYDNTYMRPRSNKDIPALVNGAAYLQSTFVQTWGSDILKLSAGVRSTKMFNLPDSYSLSKEFIFDPRFNMSYTMRNGSHTTHNLRLGYGQENKLPTLDYLYPDKIYKDFYVLNAYTNNPEYRNLITYTSIFDVANENITTNKNIKTEIGYDLTVNDFELSLTGFYESSKSGYDYYNSYVAQQYTHYSTLKPGVDISDRTPQKDDYIAQDYYTFVTMPQVLNSQLVEKSGIEYRIVFPKIDKLYTKIEINGAYYNTSYGTSMPKQRYPGIVVADFPYPMVGIYENYGSERLKRLNTNFWFNTHIPSFGLMLTNFFQVIWMESSQYSDQKNVIPSQIMNTDGSIINVTDEIASKIVNDDPTYRYLLGSIAPLDYALMDKPVSFVWNIKATKEFKKFGNLSFFVNNIVDINPIYTSGELVTEREWTNPFFGFELQITL